MPVAGGSDRFPMTMLVKVAPMSMKGVLFVLSVVVVGRVKR